MTDPAVYDRTHYFGDGCPEHELPVRVDRTGKVWRGERLIGYVDTYSPRAPSKWRYVDVAGFISPDRYPTRAAAVTALCGAA